VSRLGVDYVNRLNNRLRLFFWSPCVQGMVRNMVRKMAWGELPLFSVEHLNPSISFPSTEFKSPTTLWVMRASGNSRLPASVSARVAASCQFDFSTLSANAGSRLSQELLDCLD